MFLTLLLPNALTKIPFRALAHLDYTSHGPFIRITAKLFDGSSREKARANQRREERARMTGENESDGTIDDLKFLEIDEINPGPEDTNDRLAGGDAEIDTQGFNSGKSGQNGEVNTAFFAPGFQNEAKRLADSLGGQAVLKPLNWPSMFDIIIVTGKKPAEIVSESEIY